MPFKKGTSGKPIGRPKVLVNNNTKFIIERISQAIDYFFVWEPSQFPSESFVLPHWHLPLLLYLNSIIRFLFAVVEVEWVDKFIYNFFIKFNKIKVIK